MATLPRTYMITDKAGLNSIQPKNGQVIAVWDSDEVWYDAPNNGAPNGTPVRRKISGIRVVTSLPSPTDVADYDATQTYSVNDYCHNTDDDSNYICIEDIASPEAFDSDHWAKASTDKPMEGIVYVYLGAHGYLPADVENPGEQQLLYDMRVWVNSSWCVVGTNRGDSSVKTIVDSTGTRFYLVGSPDAESTTGTLLKSSKQNSEVYFENGIIHGDIDGHADSANTADSATNAGHALSADKDSTGQLITRYIEDASTTPISSGTRIVFTTGAGSTTNVDVADTTYSVFSPSADGLVPMPTGTAAEISEKILFGDGSWVDKDDITIGTANEAQNDVNGNEIIKYYIHSLAYDTGTDTLTVTYGDPNTTATISIPNTEYPIYPGPDSTAPVAGIVPAASASQVSTHFLRGDGTWQPIASQTYSRFTPTTDGLVPCPGASASSGYLDYQGYWTTPTDTKNTVGATSSDSQLYIVGAASQAPSTTSYTNAGAYVTGGILYSDRLQVVNLGSPANDFNIVAAYSVGNTCKYQKVYYKCTTPIAATPDVDDYDETESYDIDDQCVYEDAIYECTVAIDYSSASEYSETASYTADPQDPSQSSLCFYDDQTYRCIDTIDYSTATTYSSSSTYAEGALCFYNDPNDDPDMGTRTYRCKQNTPSPAGTFNPDYWELISDFDDTKWELISEFDFDKWHLVAEFDPDDWEIVPAQEMWNKQYEGYTLGSACEADLADELEISDSVPTCAAVNTAINSAVAPLNETLDSKIDKGSIASAYNPLKAGGYAVGAVCVYDDDLYICISAQPQGEFDSTKWSAISIIGYMDTPATDTSFTPSASLVSSTITSKKLGGHDYRITIDATNGGSPIAADTAIATSTATFSKTYATGLVDSTLALFTLDGHNLTCSIQIPASAVIKLSINALA